ncbi:MAG: VCBS domain-containing protein [Methyloprofundus sp.]|nr:VCBS domain-containing protein [Methyloprofundus sp.]
MYKKHRPLLTALILVSSFDATALGINGNSASSKPVALDDHISVVIGTFTIAEGNTSSNDLYGISYSLNGSWVGRYGTITKFSSDGEFTYELFNSTTNADLPAGGVGVERFTYTYINGRERSDTADIVIDVNANPNVRTDTPIAVDDYISTVAGVYVTAGGNVGSNDRYGTIFTLGGSWVGQYGVITSFDSAGEYSYELFSNITNASLPEGGVGIDRFTYTYSNDKGQFDTATLIIDVNADPNSTTGSNTPIARDDNITAIPNKISSVTGNVTNNDSNGDYVLLTSSSTTDYGLLLLNPDGSYTYELYETSTNVIELKAGEVVLDEFEYQYHANSGASTTAKLTVQIIGNPVDGNGDTVFGLPADEPYDNVDIEFNNRSVDATPLNSGRNIKGHLYDSGDKDWYALSSAGNEIITLEVCPKGASCFGKKSWVLYVFDSDLLAEYNYIKDDGTIGNSMEEKKFTFRRWVTETGGDTDLLGNTIITRTEVGESNHMYLAYRADFFEGALIGIVDPCFDTLNSVDIGVGDGARNYLIAISSPLRGQDNVEPGEQEAEGVSPCGAGSAVLETLSVSAGGRDIDSLGVEFVRPYTTTRQYISVFPNSDDQYAIRITGTGLNPLLIEEAAARSASVYLEAGTLEIPRVRVGKDTYRATLELDKRAQKSNDNTLNFILSDLEALSVEEVVDAYRATYNPEDKTVMIPRVTDSNTGKGYSVILQYHANKDKAWLEVISVQEIK